MVATGMHVRCFELARIRASAGRYRLAERPNAGTVPLRAAFALEYTKSGEPKTRIPDGATIREMTFSPGAGITEPGAVLVYTQYLPAEIAAPFVFAGEQFITDLEHTCQAVAFLPHLSCANVRHSGFELHMSGMSPRETNDYLQGLRLPVDPNRTMFINLFNAPNEPVADINFHLTMTYLLGRIKLRHLLLMRSPAFPPPAASQLLSNYFAFQYQAEMLRGLKGFLVSRHPGKAESKEIKLYDQRISDLISGAREMQAMFSPSERTMVELLQPD